MDILITNDDGIYAAGLRAIYRALVNRGHAVHAVAPVSEQSGVGHSLTCFTPLRVKNIDDGSFQGTAVHGTPTDCVKLALASLLPRRPDLVISGINLGQNVGPDIFYSGTIGAAAEAAHDGLPTLALSVASREGKFIDEVAAHAVDLAERIDWERIPKQRALSVNYPDQHPEKTKGLRVCPQSPAVWGNAYEERRTGGGMPYWWLVGRIDEQTLGENTDKTFLNAGYITMTPLKFEYTDMESLDLLRDMGLEG